MYCGALTDCIYFQKIRHFFPVCTGPGGKLRWIFLLQTYVVVGGRFPRFPTQNDTNTYPVPNRFHCAGSNIRESRILNLTFRRRWLFCSRTYLWTIAHFALTQRHRSATQQHWCNAHARHQIIWYDHNHNTSLYSLPPTTLRGSSLFTLHALESTTEENEEFRILAAFTRRTWASFRITARI